MENNTPSNWPDLLATAVEKIARIYDEITYELDNLEITVPSGTGDHVSSAKWTLNGALKVRVKMKNP
jgi:hypothetical protein